MNSKYRSYSTKSHHVFTKSMGRYLCLRTSELTDNRSDSIDHVPLIISIDLKEVNGTRLDEPNQFLRRKDDVWPSHSRHYGHLIVPLDRNTGYRLGRE